MIDSYEMINNAIKYKYWFTDKPSMQEILDNLRAKERILDEVESYCRGCNLKADFTACDILDIIHKVKEKL